MPIRDLCRRHVVAIDEAASVAEAARLMREHHVGALVVTAAHEGGRSVAGVVTDRDLVVEVLARGLDQGTLRIGSLVAAPPVDVPEDADAAEALARMQTHGVRRLLVTTADGHLAGLLSLDDLLPAIARPFGMLAEVLRAGAAREAAERAALPAAPELPPLRVPAMGTAGWKP